MTLQPLGRIDAELLVCTRCAVKPEDVPVAAGRFTDPDSRPRCTSTTTPTG